MPKIKTDSKKQLTVRIAAPTADDLERLALLTGVSKSVHIQMALNQYLAARAPDELKEHKK